MSTRIVTAKERPILFKSEMVRAILDGSKTQTRRIINPEPDSEYTNVRVCGPWGEFENTRESAAETLVDGRPLLKKWSLKCPYGKVGDRLWVKEAWTPVTWRAYDDGDTYEATGVRHNGGALLEVDAVTFAAWQADKIRRGRGGQLETVQNPLFMPRWASRITLEVTEVRVERLQDISVCDVMAEGTPTRPRMMSLVGADAEKERLLYSFHYRSLWESINGPGSWDANPWVWAVSFRRVASEVKA